MKNLTEWIGKLLFWAMAAALIVYAASRTLDFVNSTLSADDQTIGYLALMATTGGAIAWLAVFLHNSKGIAQKGISLVMIVLDVLGEITLFTIDTLMRSGQNGLTATLAPEEIRQTVLGMSILIGVNIVAIFAYHVMDADNMAKMENQLADWQIDLAILKAKKEKAASIAGKIADREAEAYATEQMARDRADHSLPERTVREVFGDLFKKDKAQPVSAPIGAVTVGISELVEAEQENSFRGTPTQENENHGLDGGYSGGFADADGVIHGI